MSRRGLFGIDISYSTSFNMGMSPALSVKGARVQSTDIPGVYEVPGIFSVCHMHIYHGSVDSKQYQKTADCCIKVGVIDASRIRARTTWS